LLTFAYIFYLLYRNINYCNFMKLVIKEGCLFNIQVLHWMNEKLVGLNSAYKSFVHCPKYGRWSSQELKCIVKCKVPNQLIFVALIVWIVLNASSNVINSIHICLALGRWWKLVKWSWGMASYGALEIRRTSWALCALRYTLIEISIFKPFKKNFWKLWNILDHLSIITKFKGLAFKFMYIQIKGRNFSFIKTNCLEDLEFWNLSFYDNLTNWLQYF